MSKGTVLVVDNDDTAQNLVADLLQEAGFGVVRAYDALSALCVHAALPLEAVVTASNVPGMEGTALLRALRDLNPELPLIFVTDRPARDTEARATADGATRYLRKPVDVAAFQRLGDDPLVDIAGWSADRLGRWN